MITKVVTSWVELALHRDEWAALLERSSCNEPTLSPMWMDAWWRVFGGEDGRVIRAVLIYDHGRLVGLAPLLARTARYRDLIPIRRIELIASGEPEADEICSDYVGFIAERGMEQRVARAVVNTLVQGSLGLWDEIVLDVMNAEAPMTEHIIRQLRRASLPVELVERRPCPYTPLPSRWDDYLSRLSSSDRYMVRRSGRDLEKWAGGTIEVERAESVAELERGQRILIELHGQRWQQAGTGGVFSSDKFLRFHRMIMPALLERGQLDLMWLRCKGEPIAAIYNIIWNNKVYFYQCGRRMDLPRNLRPGIAMHAYAMQHAIAMGRTSYDFLSGASRYKKQLAQGTTPLVQVRATRPGSRAALAQRLAVRGEKLARTLRDRIRERRAGGQTASTTPTAASASGDSDD